MNLSVADLLRMDSPQPVDVINVLDEYTSTSSSIGNEFYNLFQKRIKFTKRQKAHIRKSLARGIYSAAARHMQDHVNEYSKTIHTFESFYR